MPTLLRCTLCRRTDGTNSTQGDNPCSRGMDERSDSYRLSRRWGGVGIRLQLLSPLDGLRGVIEDMHVVFAELVRISVGQANLPAGNVFFWRNRPYPLDVFGSDPFLAQSA